MQITNIDLQFGQRFRNPVDDARLVGPVDGDNGVGRNGAPVAFEFARGGQADDQFVVRRKFLQSILEVGLIFVREGEAEDEGEGSVDPGHVGVAEVGVFLVKDLRQVGH